MLQRTPKREAGTSGVGATYENGRSRMLLALVLLSLALVVVLINDRQFWFGDAPTSVVEESTPEWVPSSVRPAPVSPAAPAVPAAPAKATKHIAPAKNSAVPANVSHPAVAISRTAIPPLEVEVVAGATHGTIHLGSNPEKIEMPLGSKFGSTATEQGPATVAAERVTLAKATEPAYPALSRQMKVQGSVLLQAFIGADGMIQDLRVLSGPAILASAAREAARRWQFKPYLQNGQPVETQAKITVNFTIKVLENGVRDQMDTVVALSRGGE